VVGRRGVLHFLVELGQVLDISFVHFGGADVAVRKKDACDNNNTGILII
jgi:hypothetical protein